jgi:hypothetical protein
MFRFLKRLRKSFQSESSRTRRPARALGFRPCVEALESRLVPAITYHNGALLPYVEVENVFFGNAWNDGAGGTLTAQQGQLNTFAGSITKSMYLDQLKEYSEPGYVISRGSFTDSRLLPTNPAADTTITDQAIQSALDNAITHPSTTNGSLIAPDANRLYIVYTPPNNQIFAAGLSSKPPAPTPAIPNPRFILGYHGSFTDSAGVMVHYAVVDNPIGNGQILGGGIRQLTNTTSHELAEAITNPDGKGWWDSDQNLPNGQPNPNFRNEIGDAFGGSNGFVNGYAVQPEWSNQRLAAMGNSQFLIQAPYLDSFLVNSAGVAFAIDVGGHLWQRAASGAWGAVGGSNVSQIALAPKGGVFELTTEGQLNFVSGQPNSGFTSLDPKSFVESFAVAPNGTLYDLNSQGWLRVNPTGAPDGWQNLDNFIESFAVTSRGRLYELNTQGQLQYTDGHGWQQFDSAYINFFAVDSYDAVYDLTSQGQLQYYLNTSNGSSSSSTGTGPFSVDSSVQSFALGSNLASSGITAYWLTNQGQLRRGDITQWTNVDPNTTVRWFGLAYGGGRVYDLSNTGQLRFIDGGSWQVADVKVQSAGMANDTGVYRLHTDGTLSYVDGANPPQHIDSNVQAFGLGAGGKSLFTLHTDGTLHNTEGWGWNTIDSNVQAFGLDTLGKTAFQSFGLGGGGEIPYTLHNDGSVHEAIGFSWQNNTPVFNWQTVNDYDSSPVQSIGLGLGGKSLYLLHTDGVLRNTEGWDWYTIDTGVRSFALGDGGYSLYTLHTNGNLNAVGPIFSWSSPNTTPGFSWSWQTNTPVFSWQPQPLGNVQAFGLASGGERVYILLSNALYYTDGNGWQFLDSGVQSFAVAWDGLRLYEQKNSALNFIDAAVSGVPVSGAPGQWQNLDNAIRWFTLGPGGYHADALELGGILAQFDATQSPSTATPLAAGIRLAWLDTGNGGYSLDATDAGGRLYQFTA